MRTHRILPLPPLPWFKKQEPAGCAGHVGNVPEEPDVSIQESQNSRSLPTMIERQL